MFSALLQSHYLIHFNRLCLAFDRRRKGLGFDLILHALVRILADQDLTLSRVLLNALGGVDTVANRRVFESLLGANPTPLPLDH